MFLILLLTLVVLGQMTTRQVDNAEGQRVAVTDTLLDLCNKGDNLSRELNQRGACAVAGQAAQPPSPTADGRTDAEITALIARYLRDHPPAAGRDVQPVDVIAAARQVLVANPDLFKGAQGDQGVQGVPGPGPTDAQVASAAAAYLAANRLAFMGEPGRDGRDGSNGKDGAEGAPGRGISSGPRAVRNGAGTCEWVVTYTDGTVDTSAAGDSACPGGPVIDPPDDGEDDPTPDPSTPPTTPPAGSDLTPLLGN